MSNEMFRKDEIVEGGSIGIMDAPERNEVIDEATLADRAKHMSPENDIPWTPLEDVKDEDIDAALEDLKEDEMQKYVEMYQDAIYEMRSILTDFRSSLAEGKEKVFLELKKVNAYINRFNSELDKKDSKYRGEFLARADYFLKEKGIDRQELMQEVAQELIKKTREENEARRLQESAAKETAQDRPVEAEKPKSFFGRMFR